MCVLIICQPGCDVIYFKINFIFLIKPFLLHAQKVNTKLEISRERKELLIWNKKHFLIIFEGLSLKQIKKIVLEDESQTLNMTKHIDFQF